MGTRVAILAAFIGLVLYVLLLASTLLIFYGFALLLRDSSSLGTMILFGGIALLLAALWAFKVTPRLEEIKEAIMCSQSAR